MIRFDRASVEEGGQLVVETVSLHLEPGEIWGLIGPAGGGKSMLLAAAATAVPLHGGEIIIDGHSVRRDPLAVRQRAGYVPDQPPDWPGLRAAEFLEVFALAAGLRGRALTQAVERGLTFSLLAGRGSDDIDTLDAGRRKLLLLARALLHDPPVLLLDDPFGQLDPAGRRAVEQLMADAHLMNRTVFAAIDDARVPECCTHLAVMVEGRLVASGRNDPATFAEGRRWRYQLRCLGRADEAARAVGSLVREPTVIDADTLLVAIDLAEAAPHSVVAAVVGAGIPVESAGYEPPWQAQLIDG
jgi:ABC-2 type transport system ATP-binding protein